MKRNSPANMKNTQNHVTAWKYDIGHWIFSETKRLHLTEADIAAHARGKLSAGREVRISTHLKFCTVCAALVEARQQRHSVKIIYPEAVRWACTLVEQMAQKGVPVHGPVKKGCSPKPSPIEEPSLLAAAANTVDDFGEILLGMNKTLRKLGSWAAQFSSPQARASKGGSPKQRFLAVSNKERVCSSLITLRRNQDGNWCLEFRFNGRHVGKEFLLLMNGRAKPIQLMLIPGLFGSDSEVASECKLGRHVTARALRSIRLQP